MQVGFDTRGGGGGGGGGGKGGKGGAHTVAGATMGGPAPATTVVGPASTAAPTIVRSIVTSEHRYT